MCRIFHYAHNVVQLGACFIFLTICYFISSFLTSSGRHGNVGNRNVAGDLMLFELIVVRVHCIVCIVCDWRSHDYLVVRI